ncbi:MAG: metallophosphoesterase [Pseudomonadota bacterium]|nr:metallophosphoesterase [Pseudomonadota bacterium]
MNAAVRWAALAGAIACALIGFMYWSAVRQPVVRTARIAFADWPSRDAAIQVVFVADVHVAGPDMPPSRLARIVDQINELEPDLVLLGGDFVSDKRTASARYSAEKAVAPLALLKARFGTVAVLGNHDHWRDARAIASALRKANVRLLDNSAITVGPLRIGGVDDAFTGRADVTRTVAAIRSNPGARVILSHSPDIAPSLPTDVSLLLAGHTHCGQIRLPFIGAISYMSDHGERFACGAMHEGSLRVITTAGLGTSILPLRLGTAPEIWSLRLGPTLSRP